MKHTIFIRSYRGDLPWLELSLTTLQRYATGFTEILVAFPFEDLYPFESMIRQKFSSARIPIKMQPVARMTEDYIGQQATKCHADQWTGPDAWITFWDSDLMLLGPLDATDLFYPENTGFTMDSDPSHVFTDRVRPYWLMTPYSILTEDKNVMAWKPITEKFLGEPVTYEFMRRLPITVSGHHLAAMRLFYHTRHHSFLQHDLFLMSQNGRREFSEFNLIGAYLHANHAEAYFWIDTTGSVQAPTLPTRQYWSWGGLQQSHITEINHHLHNPLLPPAPPAEPNPPAKVRDKEDGKPLEEIELPPEQEPEETL